jgi:hypothetical protein
MSQELQLLDKRIDQAKQTIELGKALDRLRSNKDFKKVFGELYFREEAIRLVTLLADPNMQTPEKQQDILGQMQAIGRVGDFLRVLEHRVMLAEGELAADEETREIILAEDAE